MPARVRKHCEEIAMRATGALGGKGLFGVEFFYSRRRRVLQRSLAAALGQPDTELRLFGKPEIV